MSDNDNNAPAPDAAAEKPVSSYLLRPVRSLNEVAQDLQARDVQDIVQAIASGGQRR